MQRKSNAIVFIGMTYPNGTIRHFALLGCELFEHCKGEDVDFYFASIAREPNKGSWDIVRRTIPEDHIIKTGTFEELVSRSVGMAEMYEKVLIHTGGGWGQTRHFVKARKRLEQCLRERVIFVGTTHSYRHDSWMRTPMSAFQYMLYRLYYRMIIFQCQYAADHFVGGNHLIKIGKGVVVPLGCESFAVDAEVPQGIAANGELSKVLSDRSLFKFVYLAAFRPGKMHVWLIHAIAPVIRAHAEARLLLCGTGNDELRKTIQTAISEECLDGQVWLTGQIARQEVPWLLTHANCAIVPSRSETFGHNFLEPMFAGLPVLGTAVGIGRDVIKHGLTGYVFDLKRPDQLKKEAERVLSDKNATSEMGANAKALVKEDFTHAAVAGRLMEVYRKLFK